MLQKASLKGKLLLGFLTIAAFVVVVALMGYYSMQAVYKDFNFISTTVTKNLKRVTKLYNYGNEANRYLMRAYMSREEKHVKRLLKSANDNFNKFEGVRKEYLADEFSPGEKEMVEKFFKTWDEFMIYARQFEALVDTMEPENLVKAIDLLDGRYREIRLDMYAQLEALDTYHTKLGEEKYAAAVKAYTESNWINLVASVSCIFCAIAMGFFIARKITTLIDSITFEIDNSSTQVAQASEQLTSASSQLSQGATESAASLEETVSSLEELSSMVKLNSDHAKEANTLSQDSLVAAEEGEQEIRKLIGSMEEMAKSSKKIEEIINVIDDIAFQTNLLALNAAVEAARAGEQGKGFAVVADAVRNLAGRSASAAKDINGLIKENVDKTRHSSIVAGTSGESLTKIVSAVKKVAGLNSEISAASQEQANGIEQITKAMNHLDAAIQSNASSSEEVASSASEMSSQAECLKEQVVSLKRFVAGGEGPMGEVVELKSKDNDRLRMVS
ncbi:methyl-accepting chemotaxis protein [Peredibacter sp. HCB2-198]|uniref:HAMP domain-containing methyl-accepting chemotaxis protein n=1 Tax=Peredibacter sp. HCB2-198 TaxID=3383025 RepID=UPI0038B4E630